MWQYGHVRFYARVCVRKRERVPARVHLAAATVSWHNIVCLRQTSHISRRAMHAQLRPLHLYDLLPTLCLHLYNLLLTLSPHRLSPLAPPPTPPLDVCIEFLVSHLRRNLNAELYRRCLDVIQRLLCYEKRQRVRLAYQWHGLWSALINLFKFLLANEAEMTARFDVLALASQVVNIFNLFVTFGDTFLPDPSSYDELYYELIRERKEFDLLYETGKQCRGGRGSSRGRDAEEETEHERRVTCSLA